VKEVDDSAFKITKQRGQLRPHHARSCQRGRGHHLLAEEIVEGISLADLMRERRCLDVQEAYLVLAGLDTALTQLDHSTLASQQAAAGGHFSAHRIRA
jgi:hypothetical protein